MTAIPGSIADALKVLDQYPELSSCIDRAKFTAQAQKKYPGGAEINDNEVTDLFTALLISEQPGLAQQGNNAATPQGALLNIEAAIKEFSLTADERKKLGDKLCNLRSSSFWDTLNELLLARSILSRLPGHKVVIEYPLGQGAKGQQPKDADVAILDPSGNPILLFDAVTPNRVTGPVASVPDQIEEWIERKYDTKFSAYCQANPSANVAVVVCLMKNEHFYTAFPMKLVMGTPAVLPGARLSGKAGLKIGLACSFRCVDGKNLLLDQIAKYPS
jgi:hypothetical protein